MTDSTLDRRTYLAGVAAAGAVGLAGCSGSDGSGTETGTLATNVTDQPGDIADFESCVVTIVGMWLGTEEAEADSDAEDNETDDPDAEEANGDGSREYYEYDEPQEADLVQLQGESTQLVDERELDVGAYEYVQLDTDGIDATLDGGESATVEVPGEAPLTFNAAFEIRADTVTSFTADFTPVKRGQSGGYILQPVAQGIAVEYETTVDEEADTGDNESSDSEQ
ncbi:DUF4382 domain-containing protein [Halobacteriaceae bacterium SHR40]|uniref:DUF4382 domain-containing protein n=1 Tax=Halovenus amylolytica TaxID=2500550 RepID=UPI000FE31436